MGNQNDAIMFVYIDKLEKKVSSRSIMPLSTLRVEVQVRLASFKIYYLYAIYKPLGRRLHYYETALIEFFANLWY